MLLLLYALFPVSLCSLDWCEYWTRIGKVSEYPECRGVQMAQPIRGRSIGDRMRKPERRIEGRGNCNSKEIWACKDCEANCANLAPACNNRAQCAMGCVCRMGLVRNQKRECVPLRECRQYRKPKIEVEETTEGLVHKIKSWIPMMNEMWREFTNRTLF